MVKRTLSDGELFAQSKNRHEVNHLKLKLEEIKYQEIQSEEVNRIEKHKWRDFLRSNSRNSGKASLAMRSGSRGDVEEGILPRSARDGFDLQSVEKYQRQWVIAYHSHSHNKLYREIEQAGASIQRTLKSPRPVVSIGSASSGDIAGLSKYATAVMGIKRVRNKMESRRPKTSLAEYRNDESVDIYFDKHKTSYTAPWLRNEDYIPIINTSESSSNKTSHSSEASSPPQEPTSNKLIESVHSMQAVAKSRDAWRCSVCGNEKLSANRFAHTVLEYRGLNKILNNLQSKSTSALPEPDAVPEEPLQQSSTPKTYCRCRKTSDTLASEKRLSLTASLSTPFTKQSANLKSPKSPTTLTHPQHARRCSIKDDIATSNENKDSDCSSPDTSKKISRSSIDNNKSPSTKMTYADDVVGVPHTDAVDVVGVPQTMPVDILTVNQRDDGIVNHEIGESNTDIDNKNRRTSTTDISTSGSSKINKNEKSNLVLSSPVDVNNVMTSSTQSIEGNCENIAFLQGASAIRLNQKLEHENRNRKTRETSFDTHFVSTPKSFESNEEIPNGTLPKRTKSSKVKDHPHTIKCGNELTIDLKAGESFFEHVAQTMKGKLTDKRAMETLIASPDKNRPKIVKYETSSNCLTPSNRVQPNNVKPTNDINANKVSANGAFKNLIEKHSNVHNGSREQLNSSIDTSGEHVRDKINSTIRAISVEPSIALRKTSGNKTIEIPGIGRDVSGTLGNSPAVLDNGVSQSPFQQDREGLHSAKSKGVTILPTSAWSYRDNDQQIWKHLEFKGIVIKNYVPPHLRYKTAASDKMKRSLSIQGRGPHGDAIVTVHEKHDKSRLVDIIFPKQARQKLLLKLIEENHRKPPSTARFVADADLRRRIDNFMKSVEPYCSR